MKLDVQTKGSFTKKLLYFWFLFCRQGMIGEPGSGCATVGAI